MPGFHLKGKNVIKTNVGSALTLITAVIVLIYAVAKSSNLRSVAGQTISMHYEDFLTSSENQLNINDLNFRIAFAFEDMQTKTLIKDPRYVRWIFKISEYKDDKW